MDKRGISRFFCDSKVSRTNEEKWDKVEDEDKYSKN